MSFAMGLADLADNVDKLAPEARLQALFDLCWENEMVDRPERATSTGYRGQDHRWSDLSPAATERRKGEPTEILGVLRAIDVEALDEADRLSYELFRRGHELNEEAAHFPGEVLVLTKMSGPHHGIAATFSVMPTERVGNLEDAVARLHGLSVYLDQHQGLLEAGLAAGVTPPRVTIADVPAALDTLLAADHAASPLLAAFRRRPDSVEPDDFETLSDEAGQAYDGGVIPAMRRFRDWVEGTYLPGCRDTIACRDLPDGEAWYEHHIRRFTTTAMTAKEIHDLGVEEVARIRSEMDAVIARAGHTGSFDEWCEHLRSDPKFFFTDADALLTAYRDIAKRIDPQLPRLFGTLPRLPYGVTPVPDHEAPSTTTAYYRPGASDAGRAGQFFANTYALSSRPKWEMEALTIHEAVPGHHLQIALAQELTDLPRFRQQSLGLTAFVEGWGLYSEHLGEEMGFYADPFSKFGQLTYEMWRAVRLVVDTGIHAFGWSRQEAIDFFAANSSKPLHDITVEVDRYISWPGQALAYKIGELTFRRLRAEATAALGDGFDLRTFHDTCLLAGALPLDLLEERVRSWIAAR